MKNNGAGLSGDGKSLQNSQGGSTPTCASIDYKQKYIELNKALTDLKRGTPSDRSLEVLGCPIDEFWHVNQYLVANNFNVKERAEFVKRLEKMGVDLFDAAWLKQTQNTIREKLDKNSANQWLLAAEAILGNMLGSTNNLERICTLIG